MPMVPGMVSQLDIDIYGGEEKWTSLHIAATSSYYRIVNMLIAKKADLFLKNVRGKTPMTSVNNNLLMIKVLKKAEIQSCVELL